MQRINKVLSAGFWWIVLSSKDARKYSLTFKSIIATIAPIALMVGVDTSSLPEGVDMLVTILEQVGLLVASVSAFIGFVRKVHLTVLGANDAINTDSLR